MKTLLGLVAAIAVLTLSGQVLAADAPGLALAKKSDCLACHAVDKKILGPSYKDVAAKYKGQAGAEDKLVAKVKAGGSGVWGPVPMSAHPDMSDADLHTIVKWVLSQ